MADYNLQRFLDAQQPDFETALGEMRAGHKTSHWIWYIFPQVKGLGFSPNSQYYGIDGLEEARAYLDHPVLGARLREITQLVLDHAADDIHVIMGSGIDARKFKSSMTLFDLVSPDDIFARALDTFYAGHRCGKTLKMCT